MNNLSYNKSLLSSLPAVHKIQKLPEVQEMISNLGNSLVLSKIREVQKDLREALTSENKINKIDIDIFLSNLRAKISEIDNDVENTNLLISNSISLSPETIISWNASEEDVKWFKNYGSWSY